MSKQRSTDKAGHTARTRLTNRGQVFLGAGSGLVIAGLSLGYADITRVGVFLLLLPLFAVLLSRTMSARLHLARTVQPFVLRPDEPATVRAVFSNTSRRASRFGAAQDRIDASLGDRPRYTVASIAGRGTATVSYLVRGRARGVHTLGPAVIEHPDPFGLCTATSVVESQDHVLVLPRTFALPVERLPAASGGNGENGHSIALHGEYDASIRSYVEGDELRRIHWPATAHRGQLMVRQEDRPERKHALLLYDARGGAHQVDGAYSSLEWAVSATASMGLHLNALKYQTHLLSPETLVSGSFENPVADEEILHSLATATECTDVTHEGVLAQGARLAASGTTIVAVVTDVNGAPLRELAASCGRGAVGVAIVIDTAAYRGESLPHGSAAQEVQQLFTETGWRAAVAGPDTSIPDAWQAATSTGRVGATPR